MRRAVNTIDEMQKLLLGYRDNMRVEVETGIAVTAKTVADLRALTAVPRKCGATGARVRHNVCKFLTMLRVVSCWNSQWSPTWAAKHAEQATRLRDRVSRCLDIFFGASNSYDWAISKCLDG